MKIKRTVTIEFDSVKITSAKHFGQTLWCEGCRRRTKFLSRAELLEIAEVVGVNRPLDKSRLHFYQRSECETLICLPSILEGQKTD